MREITEGGDTATVAAPTIVEVATGVALAHSPEERKQLNELLSRVTTLPLDQKSALLAGELQADLIKAGESIGHVDVTIGAIALAHGEKIITRNTKHFSRIPGLQVEDYTEGENTG